MHINFELSTLKLEKKKSHLMFNETYYNNDILPTYTNVRLHDKTAKWENIVQSFKKNLIMRQMEIMKKSVQKLAHKVEEKNAMLQFILGSKL